jgi:hypothetical protein
MTIARSGLANRRRSAELPATAGARVNDLGFRVLVNSISVSRWMPPSAVQASLST